MARDQRFGETTWKGWLNILFLLEHQAGGSVRDYSVARGVNFLGENTEDSAFCLPGLGLEWN